MLQLQDTGKPVYKVKNVSLNALCELYNAPVNPMKEQVRIVWSQAVMEIFKNANFLKILFLPKNLYLT